MPMSFAHKRFGTFFRAPLCVPLFVALDRKRPISHSLSWFFRCVSVEKMSVYPGGVQIWNRQGCSSEILNLTP